ncbi:MAG: prepilin-type N-terminal cleavage/methylation domain-containing protein [Phycisphaerales bacterium]|nr:prepilin-type N-terminal cleavage/methylation domain-containing protein [Phycisphaerales bacterium]
MMIIQENQCRLGRSKQRHALRAGFSLIELLVAIGIIALIAALLISSLNRATKTARRAASQRSAAALAQTVKQFQNEFGFLPPMIHDGVVVSNGLPANRPLLPDGTISEDGPIFEQPSGFKTLVVWSEGLDFNFFRKRSGLASDEISFYGASTVWANEGSWDDRRYSIYSLSYFLTGVLDKDIDGVRGPGFARPNIDGSFLGVGYPVGSSRDRYEPMIDVDRKGVRLSNDYVDTQGYPEHLLDGSDAPSVSDAYADYQTYQRPALIALVDAFGNAFRYYRWEHGRFSNGQLVVENQLDLNIPPVLIDPVVYSSIENDPLVVGEFDITNGNIKLRDATFAIVSAGPDGFFGTEAIETIAEFLSTEVPTDPEEMADLRREVWADNAVEVGS